MPAVAIPLIMAAGTGYSIYSQHKAGSLAEKQYQDQLEASRGIGDAQMGLGKQLVQAGMPGIRQATGYYSTLLGGNRAALRNVTAGPRGAIQDTYRGAERGLERAGLRGGARDQAAADLRRESAGKVAGLTTGVQPMAAEGLGNLTSGLLGAGNTAFGNAGLTSANILNSASEDKWRTMAASQNSTAAWGQLLAQLLNQYSSRGVGSAGPYGGRTGPNAYPGSPYGMVGSF